ncbi:lipoprotein-anchoring transpeptidase ErfK/SrfK [Rhizobium sp. ERR 922]|uniref:L,D-transpeptidase n=1 Tax=Rhizobium TaxID=379 RepID=UPI000DE1751A|nr:MULTISPECIES: L,D-transpeptidase [Rhizobium]MCZ3375517.1 L,D-transpeptidase [Rhizobium sp. AG207R]TWB15960.1 lipoprotein-anchoring transpeptidase ErfK/SrfK [Rhizobium sp. ERR1071]TWB50457.1 lipoprotein-anchoring transpeptidase ErfK/SrfK [Rhizobium sp. ERR 922]TWB92837.1 lipoprotein-anchoring transpeptidase ErfK/SrfK [Rhizobium sp. ERR 942]GES42569.1 L,D-transpeptidase [Rhizobium dioscoreae]
MMKHAVLFAAGALSLLASTAFADDRYQSRPPVIVSPDLTAPWVMQLGGGNVQPVVYPRPMARRAADPRMEQQANPQVRQVVQPRGLFARPAVQQVAMARPQYPAIRGQIDPQFLPQIVDYQTKEKPGSIVIDTNNRFLYLVMDGGKARRYGVGVGKPGFEWAGAHTVTRKQEWPDWTPPAEMISREAAKGHYLPAHMEGGEGNPLGARAMYLGSTLYRIHGTNAPWTIGSAVSSGCIRLRNEDVIDLYNRVKVGTRVTVM